MLYNHNVDISGFVESNVIWNPTQINSAQSLLRTRHKHASFIATCSDDHTNTAYQLGGMCMTFMHSIVRAIDQKAVDERGLG